MSVAPCLQVVGLNGPASQTTTFTMNLNPAGNCPTAERFFLKGRFWFAVYGTSTATYSCCGVNVYSP